MKNIKSLLFLFSLGMLSSCSNSELGYNEKTTSLFLSEMQQVDDVQKTFADSSLVLHASGGDTISLNTKADNTIENAQRDIQNMNDQKPSDAARQFHQGVLNYFTKIKSYGTTAKAMLAAGADKKMELYTRLMDQYKELNQMPDQLLVVQKEYQSKVGLKPKE